MSYQALLFCPDEKTARVVSQVLTDLEFAVEPCHEPFAAVKKLMTQHFDALVGQTAGFVRTDSIRKRFAAKRDSGGLVEVDLDRQAARQTSLDTILQIHSALEALCQERRFFI